MLEKWKGKTLCMQWRIGEFFDFRAWLLYYNDNNKISNINNINNTNNNPLESYKNETKYIII